MKQEAKDIELLITEVWDIYDQEDLGCLGPANVKLMLEDLSGLKDISETQVKQFLLSIDEDKTGTIDRTELSHFIHGGICMSTSDRINIPSVANYIIPWYNFLTVLMLRKMHL